MLLGTGVPYADTVNSLCSTWHALGGKVLSKVEGKATLKTWVVFRHLLVLTMLLSFVSMSLVSDMKTYGESTNANPTSTSDYAQSQTLSWVC